MPKKPPNNPPAPTLEKIWPALPSPAACAKLKAEFGLHSNSHSKNCGGKTKQTSRTYQSHHALQDAAHQGIISRGAAIAVMLRDSRRGTEHGRITARQNKRMNNKGAGGAQPATTFGAAKAQARHDLAVGLKGNRKSKKTGKPATDRQAKKLALCIVDEAEKKAKEVADAKGKALNDKTPVQQPNGCFAAGTPIWLADGGTKAIETLVAGDRVRTSAGDCQVVRVDICRHDTVELTIEGSTLIVATFHRLQEASGDWWRADRYRVGDRLASVSGPQAVKACRRLVSAGPIYSVGFARSVACPVGAAGVWAVMPEAGPPLIKYEAFIPLEEIRR
jgi:hypothetical protein